MATKKKNNPAVGKKAATMNTNPTAAST